MKDRGELKKNYIEKLNGCKFCGDNSKIDINRIFAKESKLIVFLYMLSPFMGFLMSFTIYNQIGLESLNSHFNQYIYILTATAIIPIAILHIIMKNERDDVRIFNRYRV